VITMEATEFEAERPRLMAIATRILGSPADADDVLQETWLRPAPMASTTCPPG